MRIIAIDPGYERLGIAVVERQPPKATPFGKGDSPKREVLLYSTCVRTSKDLPHAERLLKIASEVRKMIDKFEPNALAIETLFFATNQKTVMPVAEARGAVLVEAARAGLPVFEYTPLQIKIAVTGYGRSEKRQVAEMVKKLITIPDNKSVPREARDIPFYPGRKNPSLPETASAPFTKGRIRLDDEYDAIAVGLTCLASTNNRQLTTNNKTR